MTAKEFVELFYIEKDETLKLYFEKMNNTQVGCEIQKLGLNQDQMEKMKSIIDTVLIDTFYTILLGLDGESSIGNVQQTYKVYDENDCLISECGELEEYAYEYFYENK